MTLLLCFQIELDKDWWTKQLKKKCLPGDYAPDFGSGAGNNNAPETYVFDLTEKGEQALSDSDPLGYVLQKNQSWSQEQTPRQTGEKEKGMPDGTGAAADAGSCV